MESNQLRQKIGKLRQKLGLSQDDFARKANVPYTTLKYPIKVFIHKKEDPKDYWRIKENYRNKKLYPIHYPACTP